MKDKTYKQMVITLGCLLLFFVVAGIVSRLTSNPPTNNTPVVEEATIEPENKSEQEIILYPQPEQQTKEEEKEEVDLLWNYTEWDIEILATIIYQEAGGDSSSDETRIMVGNVFMNRVNSDKFPNTFEEVATQPGQYGLESGVRWPERAGNEIEKHAVARAYDCAVRILRGETLLPENVIWQAEFKQGEGVYAYQDGMYFCY